MEGRGGAPALQTDRVASGHLVMERAMVKMQIVFESGKDEFAIRLVEFWGIQLPMRGETDASSRGQGQHGHVCSWKYWWGVSHRTLHSPPAQMQCHGRRCAEM